MSERLFFCATTKQCVPAHTDEFDKAAIDLLFTSFEHCFPLSFEFEYIGLEEHIFMGECGCYDVIFTANDPASLSKLIDAYSLMMSHINLPVYDIKSWSGEYNSPIVPELQHSSLTVS